MITSPKALSPVAESVNETLPLRPVTALEYEPSHRPARAATSRAVPASGTGGGGVGVHVVRPASIGIRMGIREFIASSDQVG